MKNVILVGLISIFAISCTHVSPINGSLYTDVKTGISGKGKMGQKWGESCMTSVLGFATGDVSVESAAEAGKIRNISHVDNRVKNILGVYTEYCTIVYGK